MHYSIWRSLSDTANYGIGSRTLIMVASSNCGATATRNPPGLLVYFYLINFYEYLNVVLFFWNVLAFFPTFNFSIWQFGPPWGWRHPGRCPKTQGLNFKCIEIINKVMWGIFWALMLNTWAGSFCLLFVMGVRGYIYQFFNNFNQNYRGISDNYQFFFTLLYSYSKFDGKFTENGDTFCSVTPL